MNIMLNAQLLSSQLGFRSAGIHGYIYNLLRHLPQVLPDSWHATAYVSKDSPHQFDGLTLKRVAFNTQKPLNRILWEQAIQPAHLFNTDLYHAMTFVSPLILPAPSVVTVYDLSFIHYPQVLTTARRLYLRMFTALSCRRAQRIMAISESTARDIHKSLGIPREKIDVAACGYDQERFMPLPQADINAFKQRMGLPDRFWLFVGTLEPRKNLITLIEAYARLPAQERLPLIIGGGKGWLYDEIFAAVTLHQLSDSVHFAGFLNADDLPLWYNSAEVFVYPSIFEGFGLPVLEAMACGTPVIVSDASSLPEVVGESGLKIPPRDIDAWTDALRTAYHDATWRESTGQHGLVETRRYNWALTAQTVTNTYRQALKLHDNPR